MIFNCQKRVKGDSALFTLRWSPYIKMDRFLIHNAIPSEAGLFQIYNNDGHMLDLLFSDMAYYGGIRNHLRELVDPLWMGNSPHRKEILDGNCYARYSLCTSMGDMQDILNHLTGVDSSGRYDTILVNEIDNRGIRKE